MQMQRKGQSTLMERAIGALIVVVVLIAVLIPVLQDVTVTELTSVTNETESASSPFTFDVLTLEEAVDGVADNDNLVVFAHEASTGTNTKLPDANVTVLSDATDEDLNVTTGDTVVNSSDDSYNVTYDGKPDGYINNATTRTLVNLLPLFVALGAFLAAIGVIL